MTGQIVSRGTGLHDRTGQPIDDGDRVKVILTDIEHTGTVQEWNHQYWIVFGPRQQTQLEAVLEYCEVVKK